MANFDFKSKTKTRLLEIVQMSGVMPITTARRMTKAELVAALENLQSAAEAKTDTKSEAKADAALPAEPVAVPTTAVEADTTALPTATTPSRLSTGSHKAGEEVNPEHSPRGRSIMMTPEDLLKLEEEQPSAANEPQLKEETTVTAEKPRRSSPSTAHRKTATGIKASQAERGSASKPVQSKRSSKPKTGESLNHKPLKAAETGQSAESKPAELAANRLTESKSSPAVKANPKRISTGRSAAKKSAKSAAPEVAAPIVLHLPAAAKQESSTGTRQRSQEALDQDTSVLSQQAEEPVKTNQATANDPAVSAVTEKPALSAAAESKPAQTDTQPAAEPVTAADKSEPEQVAVPQDNQAELAAGPAARSRRFHASKKGGTADNTDTAQTAENAKAGTAATPAKMNSRSTRAAKAPAASPSSSESSLAVPENRPETEAVVVADAADSKTRGSSHHERQIDSGETVSGVLEIMPDGYGFLRRDNYLQGPKDIYVPPQFIRRLNLREGDFIVGPGRVQRDIDRYQAIYYIKSVNGLPPERVYNRPHFDRLTPIYPNVQYVLETTRNELSTRIIDLVAPIGKGQRGMIVSPPKAGKTILLQKIANAISTNNPDSKLIVLLIDERPEEVTDMQRSIKGEVVYSTFDKAPENHVKITELVLARAMRLVESGEDVVILLDSITRLGRAYNLTITPTGRTLSGGLDPGALFGPKRFFGAARNIENGGSLTIVATALIDTGSRMDEVIFEEFKGTGNMEVYLDRKLSEKRIFPAIDINRSGTRREELLLQPQALDAVWSIRKAFSQLDSANVTETIINLLLKTADNQHFISSINVSMNNKSLFESMRGPGLSANRPATNAHNVNTGYNQR
ncbi:transcription termination factor Rho [Oscillospiraceae bacterium HV4-5-C5C]|nr:transcription termination factor Rho [Oscillospiraceae bacterium HV4-5-C5C]